MQIYFVGKSQMWGIWIVLRAWVQTEEDREVTAQAEGSIGMGLELTNEYGHGCRVDQ